ncbi:MAG: hypothetical protein M1334_00845 [Patescibacteria group bacterium]|nr:hypothetical protein [Patescibacteria group bacterium]
MENLETIIKKIIELMGFKDFKVEVNESDKRGSIFISENYDLIKNNASVLVESLNHLIWQIAKEKNLPAIHLDVNNYKQERENIITELAKAAAKKAAATKQEVSLPPMNAYERRLVHVELATHPDVATESVGVGPSRYVIIKPIQE